MTPASPSANPSATPPAEQTLADRLKDLAGTSGAEYSRTPNKDGTVTVRFTYPNGDVVTGTDKDTAAAVAVLERKVRQSQAVEGFGK
jgi:hypothetical protein